MMMQTNLNDKAKERNGERGAALVTSIMISTLLLAVAGTVILTSSMSASTAIDSTSELQAYYGAESGLESALNVLRGNVAPRTAFGMPSSTKMSFRNAVTLTKSNLPSDSSTTSRFSGWLPYGSDGRVTPTGENFAYSLTITDPDDPNGTERTADPLYRPRRLVVRSTGFGPRGAKKRLEMVVQKQDFDLEPEAMLLMRGAEDGSTANLSLGDSNAKFYTGHDNSGVEPDLPSLGVTSDGDLAEADDEITKGSTVEDQKTAKISLGALPPWLQTTEGPTGARAFLDTMEANARGMDRYFTSFSGVSGTTANPAFTFVDGNATLDGGAGLIIVTGDLTLNGNPSFNGIILVLGNGRLIRSGGGSGNILGTIYVASFARSWPASENGLPHPFLAPTFQTDGAGNSELRYDSMAVQNGIDVLGTVVRDVREF